jgi:hypothetical protein
MVLGKCSSVARRRNRVSAVIECLNNSVRDLKSWVVIPQQPPEPGKIVAYYLAD